MNKEKINQTETIVLENLNADACFNLVGKAIEQCFVELKKSEKPKANKIYKTRTDFIDGKIVSSFCDCSDNFLQKKLKKNLRQFITKQ